MYPLVEYWLVYSSTTPSKIGVCEAVPDNVTHHAICEPLAPKVTV
jgi:hypothetical protein